MRLCWRAIACLLYGWLSFAGQAEAATGYVQECTNGTGAGGTTITCTFPGSVSTGNLVACAAWIQSATDTVTLTDTASNTYTAASAGYKNNTTPAARGIAHYAKNVTGSFTVITATWATGNQWRAIVCHEVSGADTSSPTDGNTGQAIQAGASSNANTSGSIVTTANGDYIFAATWDVSLGCVTQNAGTGYTGHTLSGCTGWSEHQIQSSAGSIAGTFTPVSSTDWYITFIQAFKAATSAARPRRPLFFGN